MPTSRSLDRGLAAIVGVTGALALAATPVAANVNIPEGGAVQQGSVSVITFRVLDGCAGEPTDTIEVTIPSAVGNITPQAVPGWALELEYADSETSSDGTPPGDRVVTAVRWSGGTLPAGSFGDFAMRAQFPDEEVSISFPVVQRCGDVTVAWDGDKDAERPAPIVAVGPDVGQREQLDLAEAVEALEADVVALQEELSGVNPTNLRSRVRDVEDGQTDLAERVDRLVDRLRSLEEDAESSDT